VKGCLIVLLLSTVLGGCAPFPWASPQVDVVAKKFPVKKGAAILYIYRDTRSGPTTGVNVFVDVRKIGWMTTRSFFAVVVPPGKHILRSRMVDEDGEDAALDLDAAPGVDYFIREEVTVGLFEKNHTLQFVKEDLGKAAVAKCRLIKATK
jgi:hypothetical protein